jgi:biopolymer transport protein ExbD
MAEISTHNSSDNAGGKVRAKKQSTKTDMTPMVDLAFLLLTFFLLTTTFMKPSVMSLTMPEPVKDSTLLPELGAENALTFVLAEDNKVYWWAGVDPVAEVTDYSRDGMRKILLERSQENPKLMVLIKPMDKSRYENVVDILDEVAIANISRHAIVEFADEDKSRLP